MRGVAWPAIEVGDDAMCVLCEPAEVFHEPGCVLREHSEVSGVPDMRRTRPSVVLWSPICMAHELGDVLHSPWGLVYGPGGLSRWLSDLSYEPGERGLYEPIRFGYMGSAMCHLYPAERHGCPAMCQMSPTT